MEFEVLIGNVNGESLNIGIGSEEDEQWRQGEREMRMCYFMCID